METREMSFQTLHDTMVNAVANFNIYETVEERNVQNREKVVSILTILDTLLTAEEQDIFKSLLEYRNQSYYLSEDGLREIRETFGDKQDDILERIEAVRSSLSPIKSDLNAKELDEIKVHLRYIVAPIFVLTRRR